MEQVYNQQDIVFQLLEMGFTKEQSESAFQNSPNKSIEGLILYLEAQQNSLSESNPVKQEINPDINSTEEKKEEKSLI